MSEDRNNNNTKKQGGAVECVGSLLIPQDDVKGLSSEHVATNHPTPPAQECVGSLLVPCRDLQELSTHHHHNDTATTTQGETIMHRITEELQKPLTKDGIEEMEDALQNWSS